MAEANSSRLLSHPICCLRPGYPAGALVPMEVPATPQVPPKFSQYDFESPHTRQIWRKARGEAAVQKGTPESDRRPATNSVEYMPHPSRFERWLAREVLNREIPRKPPQRERRGPPRDAQYRAFVRSFPCAACGSMLNVEAAHTGADGGMSMKSSDYSCIPLCSECHWAGYSAYHRIGLAAFVQHWQMDLPDFVARLKAAWQARGAA